MERKRVHTLDCCDSDGDGVMEYTEYFSATLESGSSGQAYIPDLVMFLDVQIQLQPTMMQPLRLMMVLVSLQLFQI